MQRFRNMGKLDCKSPVPSDIGIAQAAQSENISEIAQAAGLGNDQYDLYGTTKAKVARLPGCGAHDSLDATSTLVNVCGIFA